MKTIHRFKAISFFLIAAYLLAACGGTLPASTTSEKSPKGEANTMTFTGIVEAINGTQWTVSGQPLTLDPGVSVDPNIGIGDQVNVEANVSTDGAVVAFKVESSGKDDVAPFIEANSTPDLSHDISSTPEVSGTSDSPKDAAGNLQNEIFGPVEAITTDTITVNGVTYNLSQDFTEIKDVLAVGDQVKLHVILNADGTFTVREVEKSATTTVDDQSSNSNGSDDGANHDVNNDHSSTSGTSTEDSSNHDSNNDHGGDSGNSGQGGG